MKRVWLLSAATFIFRKQAKIFFISKITLRWSYNIIQDIILYNIIQYNTKYNMQLFRSWINFEIHLWQSPVFVKFHASSPEFHWKLDSVMDVFQRVFRSFWTRCYFQCHWEITSKGIYGCEKGYRDLILEKIAHRINSTTQLCIILTIDSSNINWYRLIPKLILHVCFTHFMILLNSG